MRRDGGGSVRVVSFNPFLFIRRITGMCSVVTGAGAAGMAGDSMMRIPTSPQEENVAV